MKTATLPSLRVTPETRQAAEALLHEGESLSAFVESSICAQIAARRAQQAFLARGLASAERARETGQYVSAETVLSKLEARLAEKHGTAR